MGNFGIHVRNGCRSNMPTFPIKGKSRKARGGSFAWNACNLWNSLPRCARDISGKKGRVGVPGIKPLNFEVFNF